MLRDAVVGHLGGGGSTSVVVDATLGAGGHARAILEASCSSMTLVGFDVDPIAHQRAADTLGLVRKKRESEDRDEKRPSIDDALTTRKKKSSSSSSSIFTETPRHQLDVSEWTCVLPTPRSVSVDTTTTTTTTTEHKVLLLRRNFASMLRDLHELHARAMLPSHSHGIDVLLMDLGVSSMQLDTSERGFSFQSGGPLDMRMDTSAVLTASEVVNTYSEADLTRIFVDYGEYSAREAKSFARRICSYRSGVWMNDTMELVEVLKLKREDVERWKSKAKKMKSSQRGSGGAAGRGAHPATRAFQALRIAVNGELEALERVVHDEKLYALLNAGGRIGIISFHSLEDRIVKRAFAAAAERDAALRVVTKRPIVADDEEVQRNPRARSAKLRVLERVASSEEHDVVSR